MLLSNGPGNKRKILTAALTLTLLITTLAGVLFINLATAIYVPQKPVIGPPLVITIQLPENKVYTGYGIPVAFTVEGSQDFGSGTAAPDRYKYFLDGEEVSFWPSDVDGGSYFYSCKARLSGLSEGTHRLSILVGLNYQDWVWWSPVPASGVSDEVVFTVNTASPRILVLSLKPYKTYDTTRLPLDFSVSEPVNWLGYSLDGEETVTITGNTTLYGLSEGSHSIVVHAEDTAGSTGASRLVTFEVETETADQPTASQSALLPTILIAVALVASAALVCFGLLAYFIKSKRKKSEA